MKYQIPIDKRSIGVNFSNSWAEVKVWAPLVKHVALKIEDLPGSVPLQKSEFGYWTLTTTVLKPGDLYRFVLDGAEAYPDPASLCQPEGVHGPSQAVELPGFAWTDQPWENPPLESYLLYEVHTGTFTPEGTFSALETKLDYLLSLGINAIEIMPIAQFSDSRNWGYDGVYTYAVQNSYGGFEGLQHLVNVCHAKGIAVVLDVVYNHFGPEGNYLEKFGPYLTDKYCTPWGKAINLDDAWCDGVRHSIIENALMWFRDFHVDALRLDAIHALKDFSAVHILQQLREEVDRFMEATGRQHYLLVESDLNDPRIIDPLASQGFGMDSQWNDEFHHALRVTVGENKQGYYVDFNGIGHLAKAYQDGYVYDGQFSEVRQRCFGRMAQQNPGQQFIVFSQNHDQIGNRLLGERSSVLYSFGAQKLMASAVLVSPYIPLLFMGEEWGETNPFYYFVSHTDPELAEAVRTGRKQEFAAFYMDQDVPDPQSEHTFEQAKIQWELLDQPGHRTLFQYYQTLLKLRRQLAPLSHLNRQQTAVQVDEEAKTLLLHRWHNEAHVLCIMNFSQQPQAVTITVTGNGAAWQKKLDSADAPWQPDAQPIDDLAPDFLNEGDKVGVPAESFLLYTQNVD